MNKSDYKDIVSIIDASRKRGNLVPLATMASPLGGAVVSTAVHGNSRMMAIHGKRVIYPVHLAALALSEIKGPIFFDSELVREMATLLSVQAAELDRLRGTATIASTVVNANNASTIVNLPTDESDAARISREMDAMMKDLSRLESELNSLQQ